VENHALRASASFTDSDVTAGTEPAGVITYQWQVFNTVTNTWDPIANATNATFTQGETLEGQSIRMQATYTDAEGHTVSNTSTPMETRWGGDIRCHGRHICNYRG
jgi:hypothetical protein